MQGGTKGMNNCLTGQAFTKECIIKLKEFSQAQQALSQELVLAKNLGICRISTYVDPEFGFKSLDLTYVSGKYTTRTVTILTKDELKRSSVT